MKTFERRLEVLEGIQATKHPVLTQEERIWKLQSLFNAGLLATVDGEYKGADENNIRIAEILNTARRRLMRKK